MILRLIACAGLLCVGATANSAPTFTAPPSITVPENIGQLVLTVTKSTKGTTYSTLWINTNDVGQTAKASIDFKAINQSMTFGNAVMAQTVTIPIVHRAGYQGTRSFIVKLAPLRYAVIGTSTITVTITDVDPSPVTWTKCADEGGTCFITGTANVRYGSGTTWTPSRAVTGSVDCSNTTWGDPLVGTVKECDTDGRVGTAPPPLPPSPPPLVQPPTPQFIAGTTVRLKYDVVAAPKCTLMNGLPYTNDPYPMLHAGDVVVLDELVSDCMSPWAVLWRVKSPTGVFIGFVFESHVVAA